MMNRAEVIKALEKWQAELEWIKGSHTWQYRKKVLAETIAALREQEQREQGCEYCNGLPDEQREDFTMPNASKKDYDIVKINFCPMCGRKLGGADHE